ncbi:MAG: hypothetical protein KR126chlam4_00004 [Candidatus Anoxychlamydiales bacterium]|nr:hypothetical protein [Candidatus Anoxychlamydiales bacterium]NGX40188.1 hypothetical protein [Candidatus Anoxychlamydiales bacterium]HEU63822.1 hypothetical protein [Chlamydiota bacterium]
MNTKKIISFITLLLISSTILFADVEDQTSLDNSTFDNLQNEAQENDASITNDLPKIEKLPDIKNTKKNKFIYLNLQTIFILPEIGLGFRHKINSHGYDLNFAIDPLVTNAAKFPIGTIGASYIKYFSSNYYFGLGLTSVFPFIFMNSPNVSFGKQFEKSFVQLKIHYGLLDALNPITFSTDKWLFFPSLSVGFAF